MTVPSFNVASALPLFGAEAAPWLHSAIEQARLRVWASIFFADIRLFEDPQRAARQLCDRLAYAAWRGVDVRVILSATKAEDIEAGNGTTAFYLSERGVAVRWFRREGYRSSHAKAVVIDHERALIGSHNWTRRGLGDGVEASLAFHSADIAAELAADFATSWARSKVLTYD